nr:hypothetical protein [Tanacetum cinerariifolium]
MIQLALMVNPTVCVSCIKQFCTSISIKKTNDVVRLQALIDRKKVIITDDTIRQAHRLDDADGVDCLLNEKIFAELVRIGYEKPSTKLTFNKAFFSAQSKFLIYIILQCMSAKRTAWNEFSSSMASAVICLATVDDLSAHNTKYTSLALIQNVFANIRRIGKGFSGVDTPLFDGLKRLWKVRTTQRVESSTNTYIDDQEDASKYEGGIAKLDADEDVTLEEVDAEVTMDAVVHGRLQESQAKVYHIDLQHAKKVLSMQDTDKAEPAEVEEVIEVETDAKLIPEVVTTAGTTITATQVLKASTPRRRRGVIIQDPEETATALVIMHFKVKFKDKRKGILIEEPKPLKRQAQIKQDEAFSRELKAELNVNINWNNVMEQVKRKEKLYNIVMRYQALKRKHVTKAQARKNMMIYLKNMVGFKMDFFKGMTYTDIRPIFEKHYNLNQAFLERVEEETIEELKTHLQIIPDDDDDVYTEATPLELKVPIVDYQIHHEHNKHYHKIIRADETHQLFLSFITLLKNFDRGDLEMLRKLV